MYEPEETSTVDMVDHASRISEKKLKGLLAQVGIPAERYKIIIKVGDPGEKILEAAEEEEVRFIILGKESVGLERILGSVSEFVLNNAKCPVLIVGNKVKGGWLEID
jgi:nucleotide-binding universal stress UspA family protein